MNRPANWDQLTPQQRRPFNTAYARSRAFRAWEHSQVTLGISVAVDGSFRANDVPSGKYELSLRAQFQNNAIDDGAGAGMAGPGVGRIDLTVNVPDVPNGRSDEPLDLGALRLVADKEIPCVKVGDRAPPFTAATLDRRGLRLDDFKGKVVLLAFWATWSAPCQAELPFLKDVHETFGGDERFAMIGLNEDQYPDPASKYVKTNGLNWPHAHLPVEGGLTASYGAVGVPSIWLIDEKGIVVAKDLRGEEIKAAVGKAMKRNEPGK
jgi:thiol-disulfide isomerase/thioredoxin